MPIAVFIPDKLINRLCNQIKAEIGKVFFNRRTDSLQRGEYPAVCAGLSVLNVALIFRIALVVRTMYEYKARRIPKFVAEIAISLAARQIEIDIAPGRRERCTSEAHCIGAERRDAIGECSARFFGNRLDQINRIKCIALRLGHFLAMRIAHQSMHIDSSEGDAARKVQAHHRHPSHPEKENIETGDEYR